MYQFVILITAYFLAHRYIYKNIAKRFNFLYLYLNSRQG